MAIGVSKNKTISVVVAFLPRESELLTRLLHDLNLAPFPIELVLSAPFSFSKFHEDLDSETVLILNDFLMRPGNLFEFVSSKKGRANQLNTGARAASSEYIWFLHVDTRVQPSCWTDISLAVASSLSSGNQAFYFGLKFYDGRPIMRWNSWWGNIRADIFGMIYGDQGFLLKKKSFFNLQAYDNSLSYGEDHDFVWRSRLAGMVWNRLNNRLETSARAYESRWLALSLKRIYLGIRQAIPFQIKYLLSTNSQIQESSAALEQVDESNGGRALGRRTALVVFVKTPGYSSLKTRLAKGIGKYKAENFHLLSCKKIEKTLKLAKEKIGIQVFWGVAEKEALSEGVWNSFPRLLQAKGGLGQRLSSMYHQLQEDFDNVIFIGADCPQLNLEDIKNSIIQLKAGNDFYLGLCDDGGYYLFAGSRFVPKNVWTDIPYSVENTAEVFMDELSKIGTVSNSNVIYSDVDTELEYRDVIKELFTSEKTTELV